MTNKCGGHNHRFRKCFVGGIFAAVGPCIATVGTSDVIEGSFNIDATLHQNLVNATTY